MKKRTCSCCNDSMSHDSQTPWHFNLRQVVIRDNGKPCHGTVPTFEFFAFNEVTEAIRVNSGVSDIELRQHLEHQVLARLGIEALSTRATVYVSYTIADYDETSQPENLINDESDYWHSPRTFLAELYKI